MLDTPRQSTQCSRQQRVKQTRLQCISQQGCSQATLTPNPPPHRPPTPPTPPTHPTPSPRTTQCVFPHMVHSQLYPTHTLIYTSSTPHLHLIYTSSIPHLYLIYT